MRASLIPAVVMLASMGLALGAVYSFKFLAKKKKRKNPLTSNLLRSPGESLREKIEDLNDDLMLNFVLIALMPLLVYSMHISESYLTGTKETTFRVTLSILLAVSFTVFPLYKLFRLWQQRLRFRLAHDAEMATGQEFNSLMRNGYHIFHDFVADKFNIDHIIVGPSGVYAVETKARAKPITGNNKFDAEVLYDGKSLKFPNWLESKPMQQAGAEADWLMNWLSSAIGERVNVTPIVALPGWYVKRTSSGGIPVINPKQIFSIVRQSNGLSLTDSMVKRIVHQLDQRCRDMEPKAYLSSSKKF